MAVKIRLRRNRRKNKPFYQIVVTDSRKPQRSKYLEKVGTYNPNSLSGTKYIRLNTPRIQHWINNGAQLSPPVERILIKSNLIGSK